jgi:HSP20 family protein
MPIRRPDPLSDLLNLQERMNRLFGESLSLLERPLRGTGWSPLVDVYETPDRYVLEAELPGLSQDDVELRVDVDGLTLRGERRFSEAGRPETFHRVERSYGPFTRSFRFPEPVDPDGIAARFVDGLLQVEIPKVRKRARPDRGH